MLRPMSSLRDQLLKAGLVSQKQARQSKHRQRVERKQKGADGVEAERAARRAKAEQAREQERAEARARSADANAVEDARNLQNQISQIVAGGRTRLDHRGRRRFYFETRDGRVLYLALSDPENDKLQSGQLGIVESDAGKVSVVDRGTAERVAGLDARWIRCWNGASQA